MNPFEDMMRRVEPCDCEYCVKKREIDQLNKQLNDHMLMIGIYTRREETEMAKAEQRAAVACFDKLTEAGRMLTEIMIRDDRDDGTEEDALGDGGIMAGIKGNA